MDLDECPLPELDSEAIDFRAASESFEPIRTLAHRNLTSPGILTKHQGRLVPTVGGGCCTGTSASATSPTPGSKSVASLERTRPASSITANSTAIPCPPSKKR